MKQQTLSFGILTLLFAATACTQDELISQSGDIEGTPMIYRYGADPGDSYRRPFAYHRRRRLAGRHDRGRQDG